MTDSSFSGYARGEGFRPYKAPYDFLARQQEQDAEIIRNLQQQKQEFDQRATKSESDMARVFDRSERMLAENQRIEDLYFANRETAVMRQARRNLEDIKTKGENEVKRFQARAELAVFAPKLLDNLVKVKEGIDTARLEAATNYAIATIMPGMDPAYSAQVQGMRDQHDAINSVADSMQKAGLPQRAVTYIRRGSNLTKYVELQQATNNLKAVYGDELNRRLLEEVKDPNDPHQVAYAAEKIQIDLLKEHGLFGYNADFLHDLYVQMRAHRNQAISRAEYDRDLKFELRETDVLKNAAFANFNATTTADYYKGLSTYRAENGAYRSKELVLTTLFQTFAENPQNFPLDKIKSVLQEMDDGEGKSLYSRVENTTRFAEFVRQYSTKVLNDHKIQNGIDNVREQQIKKANLEFLNSSDYKGDLDTVQKLIQEVEAQGFDASYLKPFIDKSNEVRTDQISQSVMLNDLLRSGRAGVDSLENLPLSKEVRAKYLPLFQKSGQFRDILGTESKMESIFKDALQTALKQTDKQISIEGLDVAAADAMSQYFIDFNARRAALGVNSDNPDAVRKAAEQSRDYIRKQILDGSGTFRTTSFKDNRLNKKAYFPAYTPKSKLTPDGQLKVTAVTPPQYFGNIKGDPRNENIASMSELQVVDQQIKQGIPVKVDDKYYEIYKRFPGYFKSPADALNNQLKLNGFDSRLGPGLHEQLRTQTTDLSLQRLINKIRTPTDLGMVTTVLQGGTRNPIYMSPKVSAAVGSRKYVLDTIAGVESGAAGYNAVNQGGSNSGRTVLGFSGDFRKMPQHGGRALTDLTVREVLNLQSGYDDYKRYPTFEAWRSAGKLHAVGRYQFIGNTLSGLIKRAGVSLDSKFDAVTQDRLALQLFKERGYSPWVGAVDHLSPDVKSRLNQIRNQLNG